MKLWRISQTENEGYDTYDSAVVAAETEEQAKTIHPSDWVQNLEEWKTLYSSWATSPDKVTAKYIGEATDDISGIVCASFNAG